MWGHIPGLYNLTVLVQQGLMPLLIPPQRTVHIKTPLQLHLNLGQGEDSKPKEIEEKRAKNLCFFYDDKYHPGHKCTFQVCRLEIMEEAEEEDSNEEEKLEQVGEGV